MTADSLKILEILGVGFGLLYILGVVTEKWWCWPAGILSVIIYGISMYYSSMFGESMLQVAYVLLSIYGWINWNKNQNEPLISKTNISELIYVLTLSSVFSVGFYFLLSYLKGDLPFWDAITNGFALGATYLVARKKIENWIFWIFIDLTLSILLFYKGFYFYSILYIIYTFMAIIGWQEWKKKL